MFKLLLLTSAILSVAISAEVFLKPTSTSGQDICLIFIQGAQISPEQYVPVTKEIQSALSPEFNVWVGIPEFILDMSNPLQIASKIDGARSTLQSQGMKASKCYIMAHSLGGVMSQIYASSYNQDIEAVILTGSFILRKYRVLNSNGLHSITFPVPILTIGGELDGLARISRTAESYWVQQKNLDASLNSTAHFPVVCLRGVNHMRFSSGTPPFLVKNRDLKSEVEELEAHQAIADAVRSFIVGLKKPVEFVKMRLLQTRFKDYTKELLTPFVEAMLLEGSYHFKPPCYASNLVNPVSPTCLKGSPWVQKAQELLGGLKNITYDINDNFHRVYSVTPIHLPKVDNECLTEGCTLKATTVSEAIYDTLDDFDTGFTPLGASEIKAKLVSRQQIYQHANIPSALFNETDSGNNCRLINEASYAWALKATGVDALARFQKHGESYTFGDDLGPYNAGPLWIWTYLNFTEKQDSNNNYVTEVRAPYMATPVDYFVSSAAGFHYCKLLSPVRALEWIYNDGLRRNYPIQP
jgi:hypothetical protein